MPISRTPGALGALPSMPLDAAKDAVDASARASHLATLNRANPTIPSELKQAAEDFEALFLNMVLKSMRDTVPKGGLLGDDHGQEIYRAMLDDEYAKLMATQRQTGIAASIEQFFLQNSGFNATPGQDGSFTPAALPGMNQSGIKAYRAQGLQETSNHGTIGDATHNRPPRPST